MFAKSISAENGDLNAVVSLASFRLSPDCLCAMSMRDSFFHFAAELDRFDAMLRQSESATATLIDWVNQFRPGHPARLLAYVVQGASAQPDIAQLARLGVTDVADIAYRRVRLVHAGMVLSDAENWYVPARLDPAMLNAMRGSATPFGTLIVSLYPTRETLSISRLWSPGEGGEVMTDRLPPRLLHHHALLRSGGGTPIAEVSEIYTRNILILAGAPARPITGLGEAKPAR